MYRDDEAARAEWIAALERDAKRAEQLADRVRELEAENDVLRDQIARLAPSPPPETSHPDIYVDAKLEAYIQRIIDATRDPKLADRILSGALPIDARRIADRACELAHRGARRYVIPADVKQAAREILPGRIIARRPGTHGGWSDEGLEQLLDQVEVP